MDKKVLFLVLIFLVILSVLALFFVSLLNVSGPHSTSSLPKGRGFLPKTTSSPETTGWQRFISEEVSGVGYSILYPPGWKQGPPVGVSDSPYPGLARGFFDNDSLKTRSSVSIHFEIARTLSQLTEAYTSFDDDQKVGAEDTVVFGIKSKRFYGPNIEEMAVPLAIGGKPGVLRIIGFPGSSMRRGDFDDLFDKMVASLRL
jgi:hypothetical protein